MKIRFIRYWSIAVGVMDALTGMLLIVAPSVVLGPLGIPEPSRDALVFLSWIGVFVMSVGLSYPMALGRRGGGEAVWAFTALVRMCVALFITVNIVSGGLAVAWGLVGISDGLVGLVQIVILRNGWWKEVPE